MLLLELALFASSLALSPNTDQDCGSQVCIYAVDSGNRVASGAAWKPNARLSRKARAKDRKANRKRSDVTLEVDVTGSRGSVFVDGRYLAGAGPHAQRVLKPGKHEIEVRDGATVVTVGVLTIPRSAAMVALVVHADR